ncbi:MAG: 1-acyl-sn-glycerol-3-phosphate acyltransferase [Gammaproteobacteria bacterium]|nr:1-acyl-sn-glycerol-3-phosphate acyltransferase [Gammaproteobacteria bacterium]
MSKQTKQNVIVGFIRASLYFIGAMVTVLIFGLIAILLALLFVPFKTRFLIVSYWAKFAIWWLKVTCGIHYEVHGEENIPAEASIIYVKHESTWETFFMQKLFPPHSWIMKRELFLVPVFGWGLASLNPIAINRSNGRKAVQQIISGGKKRLNNDQWVMVFPEGTRVPNGKMKKFGMGGALLAEKSERAIVPVAHNAGKYWPRGSFIKTPGTIQVIVGKPIESKGKSAAEINAEAEAWMHQAMTDINGFEPEHLTRKRPR